MKRYLARFRARFLTRPALVTAAAVVLAQLAAPGAQAAEDLPPTVYMAAGQAGTLQHTVASAAAKVVSDSIPTKVIVRPYSGTTAFFPIVDAGEVEFALAPSVDFGLSYAGPERLKIGGRNPYPPTPHLRLVSGGAPLLAGVLVRTESGIKSVHDLKGKTIAGNFPAHLGAYVNTFAHLLNAGLDWDDVTVVPVAGLNQGLDALVNGRVDATVYGIGAPKVREADAAVGVRFIPLDCSEAAVKRMTDAIPGYYTLTLKPGHIPGIVEDTCVTAYDLYIVASTATQAPVVAALAEALYKKAEALKEFHPVLRRWTREKAVVAHPTLPYHPAAVAAYKKLGAWPDEMDAVQQQLLAQAQ